jgi:SAM-dependent methyltransferase
MTGDGNHTAPTPPRPGAGNGEHRTPDRSSDGERGVRVTYDAIADAYDAQLRDELAGKPLDRALLTGFLDLAGPGTVADIGCGPGHVTRFLAGYRPDVVGVDLSPRMIELARRQAPALTFTVGSMLDLPVADGSWAGVVALYSIIHLSPDERVLAFREFARTLQPGGPALVAFHVDSPAFAAGDVSHLTEWFGAPVDIDVSFLDPPEVTRDLETAGFTVIATLIRLPEPGVEHPSRRCYLVARRRP